MNDMNETALVRVRELGFSYRRQPVFAGLTLGAARGECVVLAGPNGSGKSTVLALLAGILRAQTGSVSVQGRIGYVPQGDALLTDATVGENLRFFYALAHAPVPERLPFDVQRFGGKRIGALSGGMRKQVSIACALAGDPEVLLLDEPCAGLDLCFTELLTDAILRWKKQGRAVVYVSHDPAQLGACADRVVFLSRPPRYAEREELARSPGIAENVGALYRSLFAEPEKKETEEK